MCASKISSTPTSVVQVERSVRRLHRILCTFIVVSLVAAVAVSGLVVSLFSAQEALQTEMHYLSSHLVNADFGRPSSRHQHSHFAPDVGTHSSSSSSPLFDEEVQNQRFRDVSDRIGRLEALIASSTASSLSEEGAAGTSCASNSNLNSQSASSTGSLNNDGYKTLDDTYALVNQLNSRVNQLSNQYNVLANAQLATLSAEVRQLGSRHDSLKAEVYALSKHVAEDVKHSFVRLFEERFSALDESFVRQLNEQMAGMDKYVISTLNDQVVTLNEHMSTYIDREVVALDNNLVKQLNAQMRAMDLYVVDLINTQ
eukprot:gene25604-32078_t